MDCLSVAKTRGIRLLKEMFNRGKQKRAVPSLHGDTIYKRIGGAKSTITSYGNTYLYCKCLSNSHSFIRFMCFYCIGWNSKVRPNSSLRCSSHSHNRWAKVNLLELSLIECSSSLSLSLSLSLSFSLSLSLFPKGLPLSESFLRSFVLFILFFVLFARKKEREWGGVSLLLLSGRKSMFKTEFTLVKHLYIKNTISCGNTKTQLDLENR